MIISKIKKSGNYFIAPIPKKIVRKLKLKANQEVIFDIKIIKPD